MFKIMRNIRIACFNAGLSMAILIGLILFKRFAVRTRIEDTEIQSA